MAARNVHLLARSAGVFGGGPDTPSVDVKTHAATIGELALEYGFLDARGRAGLLSAERWSTGRARSYTEQLTRPWRDNVYVERLWRSLKYEDVYLLAYEAVAAPTAGIRRYFALYNCRRPDSTIANRSPVVA